MDSLDLLSYLKEQGKIEESNLKCLNEALAVIGRRDLAKKVQEFENKYKNLTPGLYIFFSFQIKKKLYYNIYYNLTLCLSFFQRLGPLFCKISCFFF